MYLLKILIFLFVFVIISDCARILVVVPTPSISHQVVFRPITQELVKRGHEVVVITTDPAFPKGQAPENLTEINVHSSYKSWKKRFLKNTNTGRKKDLILQIETGHKLLTEIVIEQSKHDEIQKLLKKGKEYFDLLIIEGWVRAAMVYSHIFKAPVVHISSFGPYFGAFENFGAPTHPILYPIAIRQRLYNLTIWDRMSELYTIYRLKKSKSYSEEVDIQILRDHFGQDVPLYSELNKNVDMLFLNVYPIWDENRPVPPGVLYIGGIHEKPRKKLPTDLESYLNSSTNGVIYVSFGTNVMPSTMPPEKIQAMLEAFAHLPYNVLWKWDLDELPGITAKIRLSKYFPQSDLLMHPNIKLFITQGGLQSADEAILAGVPMIGIPMLVDQWANTERFVKHGFGLKVDFENLTNETLKEAVETVLGDESFRRNIIKFRSLIHDQQEKPLHRAIWWLEHVLRHGGGNHLRASGANISWMEYLQLDIVAILLFGALALLSLFCVLMYYAYVVILASKNKVKQN